MDSQKIRNVAIIGHGSVGKTSLSEAMLFMGKEINRMGSISDGSTVSDYHEDEIEKQISIDSALLHLTWNDHKLNLIDAPGYSDFVSEVVSAARVTDTALIVVQADHGVEVGTEKACSLADEVEMAKVFVINRLDAERSNFKRCVSMLRESYGENVAVLQVPVHEGESFVGFVDLIKMKYLVYELDGSGNYKEEDIPEEIKPTIAEYRLRLVEEIVEHDDTLMEKYLSDELISEEELKHGLHEAVRKSELFPVLCASATRNIGTTRILDVLVNYAPSPLIHDTAEATDADEKPIQVKTTDDYVSMIFFKTLWVKNFGELSFFRVYSGKVHSGIELYNPKHNASERIGTIYTMNGKNRNEVNELAPGDIGAVAKLKHTHTGETLCEKKHIVNLKGINFPVPVIREAIVTQSKGDEDKISSALSTLHLEDPSFNYVVDDELKQTIVSGQGEMHLGVIIDRIQHRFGIQIGVEAPKIPYRETITKSLETIQRRFKKQSGGRGQFGDVHIKIEPLERGGNFEFVDKIVGGVIPGKFIPAVEKGIKETLDHGILAGFPAVDVKVTLHYGSYHNVDSSELSFKMAGSMAIKDGFMECKPVLLEPIWEIEVLCPEDYMGDVMGDISSRRGRVLGMETSGHFQVIKAQVPLAELYKYSNSLRSMTQGKGSHRRKFSHYEIVPSDTAKKVIEEKRAEDND